MNVAKENGNLPFFKEEGVEIWGVWEKAGLELLEELVIFRFVKFLEHYIGDLK